VLTKDSAEWITATYYDVRTGKACHITTIESTSEAIIPVRSYRSILKAYVNNAEAKFNGPDGKPCCRWTRGMLQRMHVVAGEHRYCGKEMRRKPEQGPVDHEVECECKLYGADGWRPTLRRFGNWRGTRSGRYEQELDYVATLSG